MPVGVLAGAIDYYIVAKLQNLRTDAVYNKVRTAPWFRTHSQLQSSAAFNPVKNVSLGEQDDFKISKKIATGAFLATVFVTGRLSILLATEWNMALRTSCLQGTLVASCDRVGRLVHMTDSQGEDTCLSELS